MPSGAFDAPNRFEFLRMLYEAGVARPERDVGFLPFRIVELYQAWSPDGGSGAPKKTPPGESGSPSAS